MKRKVWFLLITLVFLYANCTQQFSELSPGEQATGKLSTTTTVVPTTTTLSSTTTTVPAGTLPRPILDPYSVSGDPANMYVVDHVNSPVDRFYLAVRYQRPNPNESTSLPYQQNTSYNTAPNTGLGPWPALNQRGPVGGSAAQSVYQLMGNQVGILMRSWDSPHPSLLPQCQPNCTGYQKHTIYEYHWSTPQTIFTAAQNNRSLNLQARIQIPQFEEWNTGTGGAPLGVLAGQMAFVLFLEDPTGKKIQYVIFIFHSRPASYNGGEGISVETLGAGDQGYYITSSTKKSGSMRYTSVPMAAADYSNSAWSGFRLYQSQITSANLANAIADLNAKGAGLSTDVWSYKIRHVGINQEVFYENNNDAFVMGSSIENFKVFEDSP